MSGISAAPPITGWVPFDGDGLIYDHATDGNTTIIETPDFDAGFEYRIFAKNIQIDYNYNAANVTLDLFANTGNAWIAGVNLSRAGKKATDSLEAEIWIYKPAISARAHFARFFSKGMGGSELHGEKAFITSSPDTIRKARITTTAYNFDKGQIFLFKRKYTP